MEGTREDQGAAATRERERKLARERIMHVFLTSEARERLANIRTVKPDVAQAVEDQIIQIASSGKLKKQIDDDELKRFLSLLQEPKKEFKIRWA